LDNQKGDYQMNCTLRKSAALALGLALILVSGACGKAKEKAEEELSGIYEGLMLEWNGHTIQNRIWVTIPDHPVSWKVDIDSGCSAYYWPKQDPESYGGNHRLPFSVNRYEFTPNDFEVAPVARSSTKFRFARLSGRVSLRGDDSYWREVSVPEWVLREAREVENVIVTMNSYAEQEWRRWGVIDVSILVTKADDPTFNRIVNAGDTVTIIGDPDSNDWRAVF